MVFGYLLHQSKCAKPKKDRRYVFVELTFTLMAFTGSFLTTQFKLDVLNGVHQSGHTYKIALYDNTATLTAATTGYTASGELASGSGYTTGGATMAGFTTSTTGTTAYIDWTTDPSWASASFTAYGALIYNNTATGTGSVTKPALAVIDFGGAQTATSGTFTVVLPSPGATAIIRIA
jgi:hypothetical protein